MVNRAAIAGVLLVLAGGGTAAWFLASSPGSDLDSVAQALLRDVEAERRKSPIDREACRKLLQEFVAHPKHTVDRDLIRGHAWLQFLIGRSVRALDLLEPNLGVDVTTADALLASRILERRFADTGQEEIAHRGATFARTHFEATGAKSSLFLAWQLQVRRENVDRRGELAELLLDRFAGSVEARLVRTLINYPGLREEAAGARAELRKLENEFPTIPAELDLAIAWFEVQDPATFQSCLDRAERVLRSFQSSITARSLGGIVAFRLGEWAKCKAWLDALLKQYPNHGASKLWAKLAADAGVRLAAATKKNG
jgi:hypothetical protein